MSRSSSVVMTLSVLFVATAVALADDEPRQPTVKFFYYDQGRIEWAVSAEPDRLEQHLEANADSAQLYESLSAAVSELPELDQVRSRMARWIEDERNRAPDLNRSNVRVRKAEGIVAYMRAHDFRIDQLVEALLKRSQAQDVEVVAVHLVDGAGNSQYKLKIVLPYDEIGIDQQGFNVVLAAPNVTYTSVVYALAMALYEVHEIINADTGEAPQDPEADMEVLPSPDTVSPEPADTTIEPRRIQNFTNGRVQLR